MTDAVVFGGALEMLTYWAEDFDGVLFGAPVSGNPYANAGLETDKIDVAVSAGPSVFAVKQDLVSALTIGEPGPTISGTTITKASKTGPGANFGVDVTYMINKRFGAGALARYTWGSVELPGATKKLTVGGFQVGAGARVRF